MGNRAEFITSLFYLGRSKVMPGTIGSLAGLAIYFIVRQSDMLYAAAIIFLFALGMVFAGEAEKALGRKDPQVIVIDEACGMMLALFMTPFNIYFVILGFILFRTFDILKPPPARRFEKMPGSFGIMFDDVVAAVYTNIILQILARPFSPKML